MSPNLPDTTQIQATQVTHKQGQTEQPLDMRVRRTHKLLWEALMALLVEQDFEAISVKDICGRAMVHRTTFYKHYQDKYDLLLRGMGEMHEALIQRMDKASPHISDKNATRLQFIFAHVKENQHFYRIMLCGDGIAAFQNSMRTYLAGLYENGLNKLLQGKITPPIPVPVIAQFYAGALMSITAWWLENDLPYSCEEIADHFRHLIADGCHRVLGLPSTWETDV
jgi:AcrR family transcriptional regulator